MRIQRVARIVVILVGLFLLVMAVFDDHHPGVTVTLVAVGALMTLIAAFVEIIDEVSGGGMRLRIRQPEIRSLAQRICELERENRELRQVLRDILNKAASFF